MYYFLAYYVTAFFWLSIIGSSARRVHATNTFTTAAPTSWRGGAAVSRVVQYDDDADNDESSSSVLSAYELLARAVRPRLVEEQSSSPKDSMPELDKIVKAFKSLSSSQKAFKGLDGAAHEAYQRTHSSSTDQIVDLSVSGRAQRSAARAGAAADALGCCELCELAEFPARFFDLQSENGTLAGREILLNVTNVTTLLRENDNGKEANVVNVLVLYEPLYRGGSGIHHGGIEDLTEDEQKSRGAKGRLVVVVICRANSSRSGGSSSQQLMMDQSLRILEKTPRHVRLKQGPEVASVQPSLYKAAGDLITVLEPLLRTHNASAIHFTGRSLAGGVASLAATILEGEIPMPSQRKQKRRRKKRQRVDDDTEVLPKDGNLTEPAGGGNATITLAPLQGLCKGRVSALSLGAPPCMSANVQADYIISILYGDDIICRVSPESLDRFFTRTRRALKRGGVIGKRLNWMTDTVSLARTNLQSHALGSEGEEARLSIPGRAYLVRPRRLGGWCSMHEVGAQLKGGREALRAAVLWQLNDILLSKSMWKHHQLDSYIHGLDRVHLRGLDENADLED